ncbi:hypothetical protein CTEN210_10651 [Chaetoceros tenuissimus]|uniref:Uncharacterized protein n=1 Tax=Chaetoceros tenuissimus TaxID=426638 RepID=A0AAD3D087_9STRA|nr:hypothetical protein CTEN210_10651 [Chaetoceros tenuissimus]
MTSPLFEAVRTNNTQQVVDLIEKNECYDYQDEGENWSLLSWAVYVNNEELVTLFIQHKESIPVMLTNQNPSPLHLACQQGLLNIAHLLIQSFQNHVEAIDDYSNTPLHYASSNGHDKLVECLLSYGASKSMRNIYNLTPLEVSKSETCRILLKHNEESTEKERIKKRNAQMKIYLNKEMHLNEIMNKRENQDELIQLIQEAESFGLRNTLIEEAKSCVFWMDVEKQISIKKKEIVTHAPITAAQDIRLVEEFEKYLGALNEVPKVLSNLLDESYALCSKSHLEYSLSKLAKTLQIDCASKDNIPQMMELKSLLKDGCDKNTDNELLSDSISLLDKLESELALTDAIENVPTVRVPNKSLSKKEAATYFQQEDCGHIEKTVEYPLPPTATGDYIWVKSNSLQRLEQAITVLKGAVKQAESTNCNVTLLDSASLKLKQEMKNLTALRAKDEEDRANAISAARKSAKKAKKKGGKSKK